MSNEKLIENLETAIAFLRENNDCDFANVTVENLDSVHVCPIVFLGYSKHNQNIKQPAEYTDTNGTKHYQPYTKIKIKLIK